MFYVTAFNLLYTSQIKQKQWPLYPLGDYTITLVSKLISNIRVEFQKKQHVYVSTRTFIQWLKKYLFNFDFTKNQSKSSAHRNFCFLTC